MYSKTNIKKSVHISGAKTRVNICNCSKVTTV